MITSNYRKSPALAIACALIALPAAAEPGKNSKPTSVEREIQICVAEIGKHVKYGKASRVVHEVKKEQKNIAEQRFRINTTIYGGIDASAAREFSSLCVTRGPIELVSFRIDGTP
jgi:hypothetical protein